MKSVAGTLEQLVKFLTEERKDKDEAVQQILLASHPVFNQFQNLTKTTYRVFFTDEDELNQWLRTRRWEPVNKRHYDEGSYKEWFLEGTTQYIRLMEAIFDDDGKLKIYTGDTWKIIGFNWGTQGKKRGKNKMESRKETKCRPGRRERQDQCEQGNSGNNRCPLEELT